MTQGDHNWSVKNPGVLADIHACYGRNLMASANRSASDKHAYRTLFFGHNFFISSPNPIELPLIRIILKRRFYEWSIDFKTILMSSNSIWFEEKRILVFLNTQVIWSTETALIPMRRCITWRLIVTNAAWNSSFYMGAPKQFLTLKLCKQCRTRSSSSTIPKWYLIRVFPVCHSSEQIVVIRPTLSTVFLSQSDAVFQIRNRLPVTLYWKCHFKTQAKWNYIMNRKIN